MRVRMLSDLILSGLVNFIFISEEESEKQAKLTGYLQKMENYLTLFPGSHIFPPYRSGRRAGS